MKDVPICRLHDMFILTDDGRILNRRTRSNSVEGKEAGCKHSKGYRKVKIDNSTVLVHRVVYAMHHGHWPTDQVDHINGIRDDNRPDNLRNVTCSENLQNQRAPSANNKSGFLGVSWSGSGWQAQIGRNGKSRALGTFASPEEAHAAYVAAKRELHPTSTI